jgi:hypothetical protein
LNPTPRGLLLVWTNIPQDLDHGFNEWYNREHMPERILGLDGFLRGRRFVACEGGPRYLALYDTRSVAAFHTEPYLALKRHYDPVSMQYVPHFKDTRKCAAEVTAQSGAAEGGFIWATPLARAPGKADGLRAWIANALLPEAVKLPGVVSAWYAEQNEGAVAMAKQDHLRTTDHILDGLLVIEATSNEALDAAAPLMAWDRLQAHGAAPDVPAARLRNVYTLHCLQFSADK